MSKFKMNSLITASIFSLSLGFAANAADVMETHQPMNEPHTATPVYAQTTEESSQSFDGVYFGAKVGYDFNSLLEISVKEPWLGGNKKFDIEKSGLVFGGFIGFNAEIADRFVFGLEAGANYLGRETMFFINFAEANNDIMSIKPTLQPLTSGANGESQRLTDIETEKTTKRNLFKNSKIVESKYDTNAYKINEKYEGDANIRLGYAITNEFMPYVIAGGNVKSVSLSRSYDSSKVDSEYLFGWNAGAGVDIKLGESAFVRAEYRYISYSPKTFNIYEGLVGTTPTYDISSASHRASIGIGYKF